MRLELIQQLSNGLRVARNPRDWFDDPNSGTNSFHDWYTWNIGSDPLPGAGAGAPYKGLRSAVIGTDKRLGMTLFLDTNAGANQTWECVRIYQIMPVNDTSGAPEWGSFSGPMFFSMRMNRSNPAGSDTGEKYQGISLGDAWQLATPWQTGYASSTCQARAGLHWNYTLSKWQVQVFTPTEPPSAPDLINCTLQPSFTVDLDTAELALLYVPPVQVASEFGFLPRYSRLVAMINGQIVHDMFDNDRVNNLDLQGSQGGPGIYFTHGSNASSRASEAGYYTGRFWQPLPL